MAHTDSLLGTSYLRPLLLHSCKRQSPKVITATAWFHKKRSWLQVLKWAALSLQSHLRHSKWQIYSGTDHLSENSKRILQVQNKHAQENQPEGKYNLITAHIPVLLSSHLF